MDQLPLALKQRVAHFKIQDVYTDISLDRRNLVMTWTQVNAEGDLVKFGIQSSIIEPHSHVLEIMAKVCLKNVKYYATPHSRVCSVQ